MKPTFNSLVAALLLILGGCAVNPVTGQRDFVTVSESEEIRQGQTYHQSIIASYGIYDDPALQAYINGIGQQLAASSHRAHLKYTFTLLDSPEINAFALPGGYVYITRGIMAYLGSEAELAGVLGHEIGHVTARHSVRQQSGQLASSLLNVLVMATTGSEGLGNLSQQLGTGIIRGYGRDHELEADRLGAEYLHNSGFDPEVMLNVIKVLKDQEVYEQALAKKQNREPNIYHGVFSTHPENDDRLQTVVRAAKQLSVKTYRDSNQQGYFNAVEGLAWGQSIHQGVVVDNRFMHPDLAIAIQFPRDWQVKNNPEFLQAQHPQNGTLVQLGTVKRNPDESMAALVRRLSKNSKLEVEEHASVASALIQVKPTSGEFQPARISAIAIDKDRALTLLGTSSDEHFAKADREFEAINQSFTRLSKLQVKAIKPPRLRVIERGNLRSFEQLAQRSSIEFDAVNILRLLNRAYPDGKIENLKQLKIISFDP